MLEYFFVHITFKFTLTEVPNYNIVLANEPFTKYLVKKSSMISCNLMGHPFGTYAKFSENLAFSNLSPYIDRYTYVCASEGKKC